MTAVVAQWMSYAFIPIPSKDTLQCVIKMVNAVAGVGALTMMI